ncbi:MAG: site-2 protease family protein [bacterium]|nr:site-2 protease family protein [bacterium]
MTIIIFIVILALLILVHELGHFLVAKKSGIRVDEFGLGFPPKAVSIKKGETEYSLNWIPFGGFVKIFGENPDEESIEGPDKERSFVHKNRAIQSAVLVAGVTFNMIFAWFLISLGFFVGMPASSEIYPDVTNPKTMIVAVRPDSPADRAGLRTGDVLERLFSDSGSELTKPTVSEAYEFLNQEADSKVEVSYSGPHGRVGKVELMAEEGIADGRKVVGITMDSIGILKIGFFGSFWEGMKTTVMLTRAIAVALWGFVSDAFTGQADFSQVTGPVGIVGLVGEASDLGFSYLLSFTAIISIHLAVINLAPFPALDGGRLLFVAIEAIRRKAISPKIANTLNAIGFSLLILLMLVVTFKDIMKLF